jgi:eukaryotic-like serine/threonine-protein kinase
MSAPVHVGEILAGKYRVERLLGEGGMGVVVAASDLTLERLVAIKFLLPEFAQNSQAAERFLREARASVKIQSEHVARVIDVGSLPNGAPYMVMEYLQGMDLAALVEERGPLPVVDAVSFVLQACEAIAEAHANGIIHRDLKPANLFLANQPDGTNKIKVLDFGISKNTLGVSANASHALTRTTAMMGSPLYMSPEQMKSSRTVDSRTDIWALGVILYELLAGSAPFNGDTIPELSAKILLEAPASLSLARPEIPVALEKVVQRALAKDREDRYRTVGELAMALVDFGGKRSRANVERITRVLQAAGMSTGEIYLPTSLAPNTEVAAAARTQANWGITGGANKPTKRSAILGAIVGLLVLGGATTAGWIYAARWRQEPSTASAHAKQPILSPEPVASQNAVTAAVPSPNPVATVAAPTLPSDSAPALPVPLPASPAKPLAAAPGAGHVVATVPRSATSQNSTPTAVKPKIAPAAKATTSEPPASDVGRKFGGRK